MPHTTINTENRHKPRIEFIDTAKGICILLVVLLHCDLFPKDSYIGLLRMPLYFTLSGLFFKDYGGILPTIIKKSNKLLVPFFFFYTLSYLTAVIAKAIMGEGVELPYTAFITEKTFINYPVWFLWALFWSNVVFIAIRRISTSITFLGICSLGLSSFSLLMFENDTLLPLYIDSALAGLPFFFFGYYLRNTDILIPNKYDRYIWFIIISLFILAATCYIIGDKPYISIGAIKVSGSPIMYIAGAISIVLATMLLCKKIVRMPFITFIGRYSLIILGLHVTIQYFSSVGLKIIGINSESELHNIISFVVIIATCSILIKPITKYFPKFTAQKDFITWKSPETPHNRLSSTTE